MTLFRFWIRNTIATLRLRYSPYWRGYRDGLEVCERTHTNRILYIRDLEDLSTHAVVYDNTCQVWQKLASFRRIRGDSNPLHREGFIGWFQPGNARAFKTSDIALPARLLDDGL